MFLVGCGLFAYFCDWRQKYVEQVSGATVETLANISSIYDYVIIYLIMSFDLALLPEICLDIAPPNPVGFYKGSISIFVVLSEGADIGGGFLQIDGGQREMSFASVYLDEEYRYRGYGLATYLRAINHAHTNQMDFRSSNTTLTHSAVRVWEKLVEAGIAQIKEPFVPSPVYSGKFVGSAIAYQRP